MKYTFDVLRDNWITVLDLDNNKVKVGVLKLLENSQNYKCISENGIFEEYGIYQFLISFLLSGLKLKSLNEKKLLLEQGFFDMNLILKYVEECEKNRPGCFDLFSDNPFYQNKYAEELGAKKGPISKMDLYAPAGRNSLHFFSEYYIDRSLNFEECAKMLCSYLLFQPEYDGGNTSSGPNGQYHPLYFLALGKNLFETLLFNIVVEKSWFSVGHYVGNAAWEIEPTKKKKEVKSIVTLTEGLTFLNRAVLLVPNNSNYVDTIYITAGNDYDKNGNGFWEQPNCAYYTNKSGLRTHLRMTKERVWMDLDKFFDRDLSNRLLILKEYNFLRYELGCDFLNEFKYCIYYNTCKEGNKSPILKSGKYTSSINCNLLCEFEKLELLNNFIESVNSIANILFVTEEYLRNTRNKVSKEKLFLRGFNKDNFFDTIEFELLPKYLFDLDSINIEDENEYEQFIDRYNMKLKDLAIESINESIYSSDVGDNLGLKKLIELKKELIKKINQKIGGVK